MSEAPPKPAAPAGGRPFQLIDRPEELTEVVNEFLSGHASALIWTKDQEKSFNALVSNVSAAEGLLYVFTPGEFRKDLFLASLHETQGECFFSVSLTRANVFFKTKYLKYEENMGLVFQFPKQIFKAQRRKEMRFTAPAKSEIAFEDPLTPGKFLKKPLLDVSAGGAAFVVSEADSALFFTGLKLRSISFVIESRVIKITEAEVRHSMPMPVDSDHGGHKIGTQFSTVDSADLDWIRNYAFEQNKKMFAKQVG